MSLDDILYDLGRVASKAHIQIPCSGLDVWILDSGPDEIVFRNEDLKEEEISTWLKENRAFKEPDVLRHRTVKGRFRLLYQRWPAKFDIAGGDRLPISMNAMSEVMRMLDLPRSFMYDLASRKGIPFRTRQSVSTKTIGKSRLFFLDTVTDLNSGSGFVWQSPPLKDAFMSMSSSYDKVANKTCGYLGFQSNVGATGVRLAKPSLGDRLLTLLTLAKDKAHEPMLLPALAAGLWTECLQGENYRRAVMLREIQSDIGLMDIYLQPAQELIQQPMEFDNGLMDNHLQPAQKLIQQPMEFDAVHRKIVSQHAFLTNGLSEFVAELFPSTKNAMQTFRAFRCTPSQQQLQPQGKQAIPSLEAMEELEEYINHMHFRARAELQHNDRMLSRLNVYLQVLYSLMQQEVARETKRDSSAMKSISLLTMVFLPATAIATIIGPFVKTSVDEKNLVMAPQFYIFWAVSAPVTIFVLILWSVWLQRAEIAKFFERRRERKLAEQKVRGSRRSSHHTA